MRKKICAQSIKNDRRCLSTHRLLKKKSLFMLPTGATAKLYMSKINDFMDSCTYNSPLKHFSFKAIHVISSLPLQKPIKAS